jgi:hypothetical protein
VRLGHMGACACVGSSLCLAKCRRACSVSGQAALVPVHAQLMPAALANFSPAGFREAAEAARQRLVAIAKDHREDAAAFRTDLINIAKTTLSSKILTQGGCCSDVSSASHKARVRCTPPCCPWCAHPASTPHCNSPPGCPCNPNRNPACAGCCRRKEPLC